MKFPRAFWAIGKRSSFGWMNREDRLAMRAIDFHWIDLISDRYLSLSSHDSLVHIARLGPNRYLEGIPFQKVLFFCKSRESVDEIRNEFIAVVW